MPIYDYLCAVCHHQLEVLLKVGEDEPTQCPACQKPALSRELSAPRMRLSGSGWYETDEKPKNKQRYLTGSEGQASSSKESSST